MGERTRPEQQTYRYEDVTLCDETEQMMGVQYWTLEKEDVGYETAFAEGLLSRRDGPAAIWEDGSEEYYRDGLIHRIDGPAIKLASGHQEWRILGVKHREDGPAMIWKNGSSMWYYAGQRHRDNGPSAKIVFDEGIEYAWHRKDRLHRFCELGPALITRWHDGRARDEYFEHGRRYNVSGAADIRRDRQGHIQRKYYALGRPVIKDLFVALLNHGWGGVDCDGNSPKVSLVGLVSDEDIDALDFGI